jgi:hypothetical protein
MRAPLPSLLYFNKLFILYFIILLYVVFYIPLVEFYIYVCRKQQWVCRILQVKMGVCRILQMKSAIIVNINNLNNSYLNCC